MAIKKNEIYSSLRASCDKLRGTPAPPPFSAKPYEQNMKSCTARTWVNRCAPCA